MLKNIEDFTVVNSDSEADIVIVNSCTVTNSADSSVRNYINKINKDGKRVILAGCGAISKGDSLFQADKVFGVIGHSNKEKINEFLKRDKSFFELGDLNHIDSSIVSEFVGKSRAFIKIQEGCNFECSYCIIPSVRGKARSQNESLILKQVNILVDNGFSEFILTGTNVGSYGRDTKSSIASLIKKISQVRGVNRIRVGSLEPMQITDEFKELLGESFLERHLHIAIQHSSNQMLEIMNRRNRFESDLALLSEISNRGFAIGTDFIVGHPFESDELWSEAMMNLNQLPLTHIHQFTYSKRDNTKSADMPNQVRSDIAKERVKELNHIINQKSLNFKKNLKGNLRVLVESYKDGFYSGFDEYFNRVLIKSDRDLVGQWLNIDNFEVDMESIYAKI
jgi:MiaB-like tRNA modifying enzyme